MRNTFEFVPTAPNPRWMFPVNFARLGAATLEIMDGPGYVMHPIKSEYPDVTLL